MHGILRHSFKKVILSSIFSRQYSSITISPDALAYGLSFPKCWLMYSQEVSFMIILCTGLLNRKARRSKVLRTFCSSNTKFFLDTTISRRNDLLSEL